MSEMGNRLRNLFFTPHIIEHLVKMGGRTAEVIDVVPGNAELRGVGYDAQRGAFYLTFEHDTFKELANCELIPELRPQFRERPRDSETIDAVIAELERIARELDTDYARAIQGEVKSLAGNWLRGMRSSIAALRSIRD